MIRVAFIVVTALIILVSLMFLSYDDEDEWIWILAVLLAIFIGLIFSQTQVLQ